MSLLTFDDFLRDTPAAVAFRKDHRPSSRVTAPALALSKADFDRLEALIQDVTRVVRVEKATKTTKTAVDERETLIAQYLHANPAETRANAVNAVYTANAGLYERCRQEETVAGQGKTLREIYDRVEVVGKSDAESVDAEVARRIETLVAKTAGATPQQAAAFIFREDPGLYERWRTESTA